MTGAAAAMNSAASGISSPIGVIAGAPPAVPLLTETFFPSLCTGPSGDETCAAGTCRAIPSCGYGEELCGAPAGPFELRVGCH
mgnify:CR=1 FL=1